MQRFSALFLFYTKLLRFFHFYFYFLAPPKEHPPSASSGRHGERSVQQHSSGHQELPVLCRQEQGYVSRIQEQATRLPVSLRQARNRNVSRQAQSSSTLGGTDTATLNAVAERK